MTRNSDTIWVNPDEKYLKMPFVISFPRTGTNWLNTMMEEYFQKNRVLPNYGGSITFVDKFNENFMWYFSHDKELNLSCSNPIGVIYLYRNPEDVLYSVVTAHLQSSDIDEKNMRSNDLMEKYIDEYKKHLEKWLLSKNKAKTVIRYENLQKKPIETFSKVVKHFGEEINVEKFSKIFEGMTKEKIHDRGSKVMPAYFGKIYLSQEYKNKKILFNKKYKEYIRNKIISNELKSWFI